MSSEEVYQGLVKRATLHVTISFHCDDKFQASLPLPTGRVSLSYAEYLHAMGNFSLAKKYYEKAVLVSPTKGLAETSALGALGMDGVHLSANCALGQVATHTG